MTPHVHIGLVSGATAVLSVVAVLGTLHLLALSHDTRAGRAWIALGL